MNIVILQYAKLYVALLLCIILAEQLEAFSSICSQMLSDVQERLMYRTHIYIQSDILNYKPSPGDLAYPEKLEMMEVVLTNFKIFLEEI